MTGRSFSAGVGGGASLGPYDTSDNTTYWSNWSAQAQLLQYLEGSPIFSACNFNFATEWASNYGYLANSTATNTKINAFACPSDGNANQQTSTGASYGSNNSYMASTGTATIGYPEATPNAVLAQQSSGIFAYQKCYSLASVIDGSSNTVAFAEMIADDQDGSISKRPGKGTGGSGNLKAVYFPDVNTAGLALVQADIAACTAKYQADGGGTEGGGYRWACGAMGYTMFNTVIPPNGGGTIKWGACRNNSKWGRPKQRKLGLVGAAGLSNSASFSGVAMEPSEVAPVASDREGFNWEYRPPWRKSPSRKRGLSA